MRLFMATGGAVAAVALARVAPNVASVLWMLVACGWWGNEAGETACRAWYGRDGA